MEGNSLEIEKSYDKLLLELRKEHGEGNPLFVRRSKYKVPEFLELKLKEIEALREAGLVKVEPYVPPWITDGEGRHLNTEQKADPDVMAIRLLPEAEELLKSRVTPRTETVIETFQTPEEPAWKLNKRYRNLARTERGGAILCSLPDALISDIKGNIQALARGDLTRSEWKARQIWLKYELMYRSEDIPEQLRHEAEDYRDLPFTRRRRSVSKQADSLTGGE